MQLYPESNTEINPRSRLFANTELIANFESSIEAIIQDINILDQEQEILDGLISVSKRILNGESLSDIGISFNEEERSGLEVTIKSFLVNGSESSRKFLSMLIEENILVALGGAGILKDSCIIELYGMAIDPRQLGSRYLFRIIMEYIVSMPHDTDNICGKIRAAIMGSVFGDMQEKTSEQFSSIYLNESLNNTWIHDNEWYLLWDWRCSIGSHADAKRFYKRNMDSLLSIFPRIRLSSYLYEMGGVSCFGRYDNFTLLEGGSPLEKGDVGLVASCIDDHNGALYETKQALGEFSREQKKGGVCHMGIVEYSTFEDFIKRLNNLKVIRNQLGIDKPFKYLVIQAHGSSDHIQFGDIGDSEHDGTIHILGHEVEIFGRYLKRAWSKFFDPNGTLVLSFCEGGLGNDNIAKTISGIMPNITVVASNKKSYLKKISYKNEIISADFREFQDENNLPKTKRNTAIYYKGGKRVSNLSNSK